MLGLAVDLGRVLIAKNETQSFTDTAAMAAVLKLNGISFTAARNAVTNNTKNQWNMGTTVFTASAAPPRLRPNSPSHNWPDFAE
jgi:uncharacterized membrane protein